MNDETLQAFEAVIAALRPLDAQSRLRVLNSVHALLGLSAEVVTTPPVEAKDGRATSPGTARPLSLMELLQEYDNPTNPQLITVFAYYRDKYEGLPRFAKSDLRDYFPKSRRDPPANYDRDFAKAVEGAWIHEDGGDSYITTRGIEAVETGFPGERRSAKKVRKPAKKATVKKIPKKSRK